MWSSDARPITRPIIGYVLKRFPRLSETFVLNEMLALERQGFAIEVFSLKRPLDEPRHAELARLEARVTYVSDHARRERGADADPTLAALLPMLLPGKAEKERAALLDKALAVARLARAAGAGHLHAHFASDAAAAALLAGRAAGLPFSFTAHARDIYHCYVSPEVDDAARRARIAEARFVATVSEFNRSHLRSLAGPRHAARIVRLYNGVDLARFAADPAVERVPRTILSVGRLVEKKGLPDLVEACRLLDRRGISFSCEIIGDGPLGPALEAQIAAGGLGGKVRLRGALPQSDVLAAMQTASLFVLPCVVTASGDQDGLPTVLLEALAAGLPAISTRVAGIPEIIEDEVGGLLVEPGSPRSLADAMARILDDPELGARLAAAGRTHAERHFDLDANAARLGRLLRRSASAAPARESRGADAYRLSLG